MKIGELALAAQCSVEAIRYYERALQLSDPANPSPLIPRATILQRLEQLQP